MEAELAENKTYIRGTCLLGTSRQIWTFDDLKPWQDVEIIHRGWDEGQIRTTEAEKITKKKSNLTDGLIDVAKEAGKLVITSRNFK